MASVDRPFVPGSGNTAPTPAVPVSPPKAAQTGHWTADDATFQGGAAAVGKDPTVFTQGDGQVLLGQAQNAALETLLNDPKNYSPNTLSGLRQPNYRFRLFMTTEHELMTGATQDAKQIYATLDSIPQVTIAQTGVTAGFNITDVEMDQAAGPGFRNRSNLMSGININIVEPLGSSLTESIMTAAMELGVQNFAKMWYFLELSFVAYDENGAINLNPLEPMGLRNGGRWIYQVSINDMNVQMDEGGAKYRLTCTPYSMLAFDDEGAGRVPEVMRVGGGTIKEFCDNFAAELTKKWTERYFGEIYKFNIVFKPIGGDGANGPDPSSFKLQQSEFDSIKNMSMSQKDSRIPEAQIPRGVTIADVINFLFCNCEDTQKLMLDTNSPYELKDDGGEAGGSGESLKAKFNGKLYRVPIVPVIEPSVKITGYDPITGHYMKEITYYVWGYRVYTTNLCVEQFNNIKDDPQVAVKIVQELQSHNYLKKRYEYMYTGLNTEVIKFDINYNFAFSAILPKVTGWRSGVKQVSVQEKYNPSALKNNADMKDQTNDTNVQDAKALQTVQTAIASSDSVISDSQKVLDNQSATDADKQKAQQTIDAALKDRERYRQSATQIRSKALADQKTNREEIERKGVVNIYAEDALTSKTSFNMTYEQAHDEGVNAAGGSFMGQWHRGASLTGSLLSQIYTPIGALAQIELEIKGDPYWISYSDLERKGLVLQSQSTRDVNSVLPNYADGDTTIALIFRFPSRIGDNGLPVLRSDDIFNGVYRVFNIRSTFSGGEFKQVLTASKLELITPAAMSNNNAPPSGGTAAGT